MVFPKYEPEYTREGKLKIKIRNSMREKPTKDLVFNLRDNRNKLVAKLVVENMYGGRYNLHKVYNKGKSRVTLLFVVNLNKVVKRMLEEREKASNPILYKLRKVKK